MTGVLSKESRIPEQDQGARVAVVIPCFRVTRHVMHVIDRVGPEVDVVYCVDDACPDRSGDFIEENCTDQRVRVLRHAENQGVGGAVLTGYEHAVSEGATVIVKIDGDGQMDPRLVSSFINPILRGEADYTKGNRFFDLKRIHEMPPVRIFGNAVLSLFTKVSTGYWDIFDPTNGYTAIHANVARFIPTKKISKRYFFETDMLFRLSILRAVVVDIPMDATYGDEDSGLKARQVVGEFALKHLRNLAKRIAYNYLLRDLPLASLQLFIGAALVLFGMAFGGWHWWISATTQVTASAGTVMIPTMSLLVGIQLLLAFLSYDISNVPRRAIHSLLTQRFSALEPERDHG